MLKVFADTSGLVTYTAAELCAALNTLSGKLDYVQKGIDDELSLDYTDVALNCSVNLGKAIISGRPCGVFDDPEPLTLPANTTGINVCLEIDLSQPMGQEAQLVALTDAQLAYDDINNNGGRHDLVLYKVNTNSMGVTSVQDKRVIKDCSWGVILTESEYQALAVKDPNTLYYVTED